MEIKRCAIYCRKSVEDASTMEFNSLDAQRESGENYIASQKSNGWICLPERYDDNGWSGGNIERPALKRLLDDIRAGKVDIVVTYKIDRLSRSLLDFSELQTIFDQHGVSFVSVTQEINTSSSAGRMMLNILMTFAQYEREIIGERIRDKIAASKKRGKHCGGSPVLGYRTNPDTRKLEIVPDEATLVTIIFQKYFANHSLAKTVTEVNRLGHRTKHWFSVKGKEHGGKTWDTGTIHKILINPLYAGLIKHYDVRYKGEHQPIVPREMWEAVQKVLNGNSNGTSSRQRQSKYCTLVGLVYCGNCNGRLTPTYAKKNGRTYTYYFCQKSSKNPDHHCPIKRLPSGELEQAVVMQLSKLLQMPTILRETLTAVHKKEREVLQRLRNDESVLKTQMADLKNGLIDGSTELAEVKHLGERLAEVRRQIRILENRRQLRKSSPP